MYITIFTIPENSIFVYLPNLGYYCYLKFQEFEKQTTAGLEFTKFLRNLQVEGRKFFCYKQKMLNPKPLCKAILLREALKSVKEIMN